MLTTTFLRLLEIKLGKKLRQKIHIRRITPVSGGSINLATKLDTNAGIFFLKANDPFRFPMMFEKEAHALVKLKSTNTFTIPEVIMTGEEDGLSFLLLKFIESKSMKKDFWQNFGASLAKLHQETYPRFGYTEDNYIGSLNQSNKEYNRWIDFFIEERLEKQLQLALKTGKLLATDTQLFKKLYLHIDSLISEEPPALLHGDLWSGNFIIGDDGEPCLIDPAIYFGHREMDLAMTKLFGGFDQLFYDSYHDTYPLAVGFDERIDIHNLYPLMVHVNLFGGKYISQVREILKRFN